MEKNSNINQFFEKYIKSLQETPLSQKTEFTDRDSLKHLLENIVVVSLNQDLKIIHESKRNHEGLGAPDFLIENKGTIVGYLENKKLGEDLDKIKDSEQIKKYQKLSQNILLTNYNEWMWLKEDEEPVKITLFTLEDLENPRFKPNPQKVEELYQLISNFLSSPPQGVATAEKLASALAIRTRHLRDFLDEELSRQKQGDGNKGKLISLHNEFINKISKDLTIKEFADAFAQTLAYGLFLAKLNTKANEIIELYSAERFIPNNFALIQGLVDFVDEIEKREEYKDIRWIVREILHIINNLDLAAVKEDLSFAQKQQSFQPKDDEDRLLFERDPYIYFYEYFLSQYDKNMRKAKGVYYTPKPVVSFIVRAVDDVLKNELGIDQGLANKSKVTVLDFATGTGTFLLEVMQQILNSIPPDSPKKEGLIQEHILQNLYGFEYLIAPYTIAHLKLSQYLLEQGYELKDRERLQVYLANTLAEVSVQGELSGLFPELTEEAEKAQEIKEKKILAIVGNPPYSGHSTNVYDIEDYYKVDGVKLDEKNPKWLQDDYVKFIRFAQNKMENVEQGVVAVITSHSFLDNPTFRGMRQSLMKTFDKIYFLDLHGNTKKKEISPDGSKDENVFDIEQGVCVSVFIKGGK